MIDAGVRLIQFCYWGLYIAAGVRTAFIGETE